LPHVLLHECFKNPLRLAALLHWDDYRYEGSRPMDPLMLIGSIGLPAVMAIGGILAWRATRRQHVSEEREMTSPAWRDTSLDDWRRERDQQAELERQQREAGVGREGLSEGQEREADTQKKTHTRLGG
jgi:hypothetical protein